MLGLYSFQNLATSSLSSRDFSNKSNNYTIDTKQYLTLQFNKCSKFPNPFILHSLSLLFKSRLGHLDCMVAAVSGRVVVTECYVTSIKINLSIVPEVVEVH